MWASLREVETELKASEAITEDQVGKVDLLPTVREFNFFFIFPFYPCPSFYPPSFLNSPLTHHLQLQTSDPTTPNTTIRNIHFLAENLHCCMRSTTIIFSLLFLLYSLLCQILYVISKSHCHSKDKQQQPHTSNIHLVYVKLQNYP